MDRAICFIVTVSVAFKTRSSAKIKAAELLHNKGSVLYLSLRRLFVVNVRELVILAEEARVPE